MAVFKKGVLGIIQGRLGSVNNHVAKSVGYSSPKLLVSSVPATAGESLHRSRFSAVSSFSSWFSQFLFLNNRFFVSKSLSPFQLFVKLNFDALDKNLVWHHSRIVLSSGTLQFGLIKQIVIAPDRRYIIVSLVDFAPALSRSGNIVFSVFGCSSSNISFYTLSLNRYSSGNRLVFKSSIVVPIGVNYFYFNFFDKVLKKSTKNTVVLV